VNNPLERNAENDYTLKPGHTSAWITVDSMSIYIHRTDTGVQVDILPLNNEMVEPIDTAIANY